MGALKGIAKDQKAGPNQGGYAYRGIEAITRQAQPLFAREGILLVPHVEAPEVFNIVVNDRPWTDTRMLVSYTVYGPGGPEDKIELGPLFAIGRDNSDKGANKCMTQAFKYALLQLLCISDAADDTDGTDAEADTPPTLTSVHPAQGDPWPEGLKRTTANGYLLAELRALGMPDKMSRSLYFEDEPPMTMATAREIIGQLHTEDPS
jgi:hypothetical protein